MRKFRMGENNIIVALSSLEELKDIPDCHLVIRFNVPTTYRSYIQSKVGQSQSTNNCSTHDRYVYVSCLGQSKSSNATFLYACRTERIRNISRQS
jgi:ERCC4-related helicase